MRAAPWAPENGWMKTPCVNICVIDQATRLCSGCFRSIDEIARWRSYTDSERDSIMAELPGRQARSPIEAPRASGAGR